jgi:hypothetical protein
MGEAKRRKTGPSIDQPTKPNFAIVYFAVGDFGPGFVAFHPDGSEPEFIREGHEDRSRAENRAYYRWQVKPILEGLSPDRKMRELINSSPLTAYVEATTKKLHSGERWQCLLCPPETEPGPGVMPVYILLTVVMFKSPLTGKDEGTPIASFICRQCHVSHPHKELKIKARARIEADITVSCATPE